MRLSPKDVKDNRSEKMNMAKYRERSDWEAQTQDEEFDDGCEMERA